MADPVLVTGAAGFIGYHTARRLLDDGEAVVGIDNCNDYYDPALKHARLAALAPYERFSFVAGDLADRATVDGLFAGSPFRQVIHLAAQAGVRYSLTNPHAYASANLVAFLNILEACRHHEVGHLVYASSSSVYGNRRDTPFSEHAPCDHPVSLYAATKRANELMAHSYSHLYGLPATGLRFFTVYGPYGRPDMAYYTFTHKMLAGEVIPVFNHGELWRDFTYIDDIVEGVVRLRHHPPRPIAADAATSPATARVPYRVYNIGNHQPVKVIDFVRILERVLGVEARIDLRPMQPGDVHTTCAATDDLRAAVDFAPRTALADGLTRFAHWYREYHQV